MSLQSIRKNYAEVAAVVSLSLDVEAGQRLVLLGPSGCGKTTTLRLVAGLESPDAGRIILNGDDITTWPSHRRGVALVNQDAALYPHLNVRDNLALGAQLRGLSIKEIAERIDAVAQRLHIVPLLQRRADVLSGGERRRVALGRALVRRPTLLLLDEPLSGLDASARFALRSELARLQQETPTTVLHVTHDQEEAMLLGDRLAVMRTGCIEQLGTPREVYDHPSNVFVAGFLGSPPMNFLRRSRAGKRCLLGVRPRDLHLANPDSADLVARVENVQTMGHEWLVTVRETEVLLIVTREKPSVQIGDQVGLRIDVASTHWFDEHTGQRLAD